MFFLSYTRSNSAFALKLAKDLKKNGISLWIDQLDIPTGKRWDAEVENALKTAEGVIVILTPESVKSNNVQDEISYAIEENKKLIPVMAEHCQLPFRLRRFQYVDLSKDYDTGLADLLQDFNTVTENNSGVVQNIVSNANIPVVNEVKEIHSVKPEAGSFLKNKFLVGGIAAIVLVVIGYFVFFNKTSDKKTEQQVDNSITNDSLTNPPKIDSGNLHAVDSTIKVNEGEKITEKKTEEKPREKEEPPLRPVKLPAGSVSYNKGLKSYRSGNYNSASTFFTSAIDSNYKKEHAYRYRAICNDSLKQYKPAIDDYTIVLRSNGEDRESRLGRAKNYYSLGMYSESAGDYTYLLKQGKETLGSAYGQFLYLRGNCYLRLKNQSQACADYKAAFAAGETKAEGAYRKLCVISPASTIRGLKVIVSSVTKGTVTQQTFYLEGEQRLLDNITEVNYYFGGYFFGQAIKSDKRSEKFKVQISTGTKYATIHLLITTVNGEKSEKTQMTPVAQTPVKVVSVLDKSKVN